MPWKCPACSEQIRHSQCEDQPRPGGIYRCHICRLELVLDLGSAKLTVAPLPDGPHTGFDRGTPRTTR